MPQNQKEDLSNTQRKVYSSYASEPVAAYAIGDEIAELGKVMPLNTLLNAVYEDIKAYLSESEGV